MPWGSSGLLQNTGTSKGAFHRLAEGTLLNYFELTDCNTMLRSPNALGSLASTLPACLPSAGTDRRRLCPGSWVPLPCRLPGGGDTGLCPPLVFYWEKHLRRSLVGGGGQRILPQLRPINISYRWNKNDYIPASTFLVYFKCVTAFYFLPRLCFL